MGQHLDIDDSDFERLLGDEPAERIAPDDGPVAGFLSAMKAAYPEESTTALEARQLPFILEVAQAVRASDEAGSLIARSMLASRARSRHIARMAHAWIPTAVLVAVAVLAFGGAAFAGVLPAPLQQAIADAARVVGVHLPTPHDRASGRAGGPRGVSEEMYGGGWSSDRADESGEATVSAAAGGAGSSASAESTPGAGRSHSASGTPGASAGATQPPGAKGKAGSAAGKSTKVKKSAKKSKKSSPKSGAKKAKKAKKTEKAEKTEKAKKSKASQTGDSDSGGSADKSKGGKKQ